ncbi:PIN domain-like protein [Echria macrotheca]|uniref:PIN domain-like protein n=1 Tax=Echria macrotheca TaxID=438768 RepID=A0AAJ0BKT6_9PEZI|nr:PIN domain-like protein [Echria macrotheca]
MGINGLWEAVKETKACRTVTLADLGAECFREKGRPLRIAVDTPTLLFPITAATKNSLDNAREEAQIKSQAVMMHGMNHSVRTFYQHILDVLASGVQPIFVFDGPGKPPKKRDEKRNKKRDGDSDCDVYTQPCSHVVGLVERGLITQPGPPVPRLQSDSDCEFKLSHAIPLCHSLLKHLGLPYRDAPGEAEAECAALEKAGVVDAVMTCDGDAFVFGSRVVLKKLSKKDNNVQVGVVVEQYRMQDLEAAMPPLRRPDMFLLAMMAGGDYDGGLPGCGPPAALAAARGWFGKQLEALIIGMHSDESLAGWKQKLAGELKTRWPSVAASISRVKIDTFPSRTLANYYLRPLVSKMDGGLITVEWDQPIPVSELRQFTAEFFDWRYKMFAGKFVRTLAFPLLVRNLLSHGAKGTDGSDMIQDITLQKENQLRVMFLPSRAVPYDMDQEEYRADFKPANMKKVFNPKEPYLEWIPEWIVEYGAPAAARKWKQRLSDKEAPAKKRKSGDLDSANTPKRTRGRPRKDQSIAAATSPANPVPEALTPIQQPRRIPQPRIPSSAKGGVVIDLTGD